MDSFSIGSFLEANYRNGDITSTEAARESRSQGRDSSFRGRTDEVSETEPETPPVDDMLVFRPSEDGGRGENRLVRHVKFERKGPTVANALTRPTRSAGQPTRTQSTQRSP